MPHAPYSPDTNPCEHNCFGPLKEKVKGRRYSDLAALRTAICEAIQEGNQRGIFNGVTSLPEVWEAIIQKVETSDN